MNKVKLSSKQYFGQHHGVSSISATARVICNKAHKSQRPPKVLHKPDKKSRHRSGSQFVLFPACLCHTCKTCLSAMEYSEYYSLLQLRLAACTMAHKPIPASEGLLLRLLYRRVLVTVPLPMSSGSYPAASAIDRAGCPAHDDAKVENPQHQETSLQGPQPVRSM